MTMTCGYRECGKKFKPKGAYPPQKYCTRACGDAERHRKFYDRRRDQKAKSA